MSHVDGRPRTYFSPTWVLLGILALALFPASGSAAPAETDRRDRATAADSDGDGIADDFDPDDDNDGVADDQEGAAPGPDILAPDKDTDGDGISNVLDPDDNNNAVTDENDPSSFPPTSDGGSSGPGAGGPSTSPRPSNTRPDTSDDDSSSGQSDLVIQALPDTGSGSTVAQSSVGLVAAFATALTATLGVFVLAWQAQGWLRGR